MLCEIFLNHWFLIEIVCSDQFDPFNRAPLTMEMVVPNTELKAKIDQWKEDNNLSTDS